MYFDNMGFILWAKSTIIPPPLTNLLSNVMHLPYGLFQTHIAFFRTLTDFIHFFLYFPADQCTKHSPLSISLINRLLSISLWQNYFNIIQFISFFTIQLFNTIDLNFINLSHTWRDPKILIMDGRLHHKSISLILHHGFTTLHYLRNNIPSFRTLGHLKLISFVIINGVIIPDTFVPLTALLHSPSSVPFSSNLLSKYLNSNTYFNTIHPSVAIQHDFTPRTLLIHNHYLTLYIYFHTSPITHHFYKHS